MGIGIIYGLIAAVCWGTADLLARYATRQVGTYRTLLFMNIVGFVGLSLVVLLNGELARAASQSWQPWAWAVLYVLLNMAGSLTLYRSFEIGILSIVSPIAASYAAITVVLSVLSGERLAWLTAIGIAVVLVGVLMAATGSLPETKAGEQLKGSRLTAGVGWALVAAVCYGVAYWLLGKEIAPILGGFAPVWLVRLLTPLLLASFARPARQPISLPQGEVWWLLIGVGVLDTTAFVASAVGLATDSTAVVSVVSSLFSAVTVLLAWIFLREKLRWWQWLGIAVVLVGVVLVSMPPPPLLKAGGG